MKIYLAIPYTWNPLKSFEIANILTARLMEAGHVVFSPISHSHPVADHLPEQFRFDNVFWMDQDLPFVDWAEELHYVLIGSDGQELIDNSIGVQTEIAHAKRTNKPIHIIKFYD